jgi:hypothetical protein
MIRLQVFRRISNCRRDVPAEATMQMTTIGGRPEFDDAERDVALVVLWHK